VAQLVAQVVADAHWYGAHVLDPLPVQLPPAPHNGPLSVPAAQLTVPQGALTAALQVPEPSHVSSLQVATLAVHSALGSLPALAKVHAVPATLSTWQGGHDATTPQRRPLCAWTQKLLKHWLPVLQTAPLASFP